MVVVPTSVTIGPHLSGSYSWALYYLGRPDVLALWFVYSCHR